MQIIKATKQDQKEAMKVAISLKDWFNEDGLKNMKIDFALNNLVVAKENGKVSGFLCYSSYSGKMLLMWTGVKKEAQRKGVGQKLLKWLEDEGKKFGFHAIERLKLCRMKMITNPIKELDLFITRMDSNEFFTKRRGFRVGMTKLFLKKSFEN